jgi:hypothetical protein
MKFLILISFAAFLQGCDNITTAKPCGYIKADWVDPGKSKECKQGKVSLLPSGIHDTLAVDLLININEYKTGQPIQGAVVEIINISSATTNKKGEANFIAFYQSGGIFSISVSHPDHSCLKIDSLRFGSGEIWRANILLKKDS